MRSQKPSLDDIDDSGYFIKNIYFNLESCINLVGILKVNNISELTHLIFLLSLLCCRQVVRFNIDISINIDHSR